MTLLYRNGVAVHIQGDPNSEYIAAKIHEAMTALQRLKERNDGYLDIIELNALDYNVRSVMGRDEIFIYPPPVIEEKEERIPHEQLATMESLFFTIDELEERVWQGEYTGRHIAMGISGISPHAFTVPFSNKDIVGTKEDYWGYLPRAAENGEIIWNSVLLEGESLQEWPYFMDLRPQDEGEHNLGSGCWTVMWTPQGPANTDGFPGLLGGWEHYAQWHTVSYGGYSIYIYECNRFLPGSTLYFQNPVGDITAHPRMGSGNGSWTAGFVKAYIFDPLPPVFVVPLRESNFFEYSEETQEDDVQYWQWDYYIIAPDAGGTYQITKIEFPHTGANNEADAFGPVITDVAGNEHFGGYSFRLCLARAYAEDFTHI